MPLKQIASNAGAEGSVIVEKLLSGEMGGETYGWNAATEEFMDMMDAGVIDPRKVTRTALQDAAGVASLMCTSECMIVDNPAEEGGGGGAMPGGMGGMGGGMGGMPGMM